MRYIDKYDEKSSRQHIRRVKEILTNPPVLTAQTETGILGSAQTQTVQEEVKQEDKPKEGEEKQSDQQPAATEQEDKLKKQYEEFMQIIEKESKKEIPLPQKNG